MHQRQKGLAECLIPLSGDLAMKHLFPAFASPQSDSRTWLASLDQMAALQATQLVPAHYELSWSVHDAIFTYGMALLDNALLQPLAEVCAAEGHYEFMLMIAPLFVEGLPATLQSFWLLEAMRHRRVHSLRILTLPESTTTHAQSIAKAVQRLSA
jgi:hypothetical protein